MIQNPELHCKGQKSSDLFTNINAKFELKYQQIESNSSFKKKGIIYLNVAYSRKQHWFVTLIYSVWFWLVFSTVRSTARKVTVFKINKLSFSTIFSNKISATRSSCKNCYPEKVFKDGTRPSAQVYSHVILTKRPTKSLNGFLDNIFKIDNYVKTG